MSGDENLLDQVGTLAVIIGVVIIVYMLLSGGGIQAITTAIEAGSQLIIIGILAIVGGGAVLAYVRR